MAGFLGKKMGVKLTHLVTVSLMFVSAFLSWNIFVGLINNDLSMYVCEISPWIKVGQLEVYWSLKVDTLSSIMLVVVTSVSSLVHLYSTSYMHHDPSQQRFMSYLSLFTFMMLMLVTAENMLQLFFGWEGVGVCSYLLIGFWFKKESANQASMKAFLVNRVADLSFVVGLGCLFLTFNTLDINDINSRVETMSGLYQVAFGVKWDVIELISLLLFIGAMGKSAQIILHTWLPDAMEGPTPVSALIHAATMVTAGVFLVVRLSPVYELAPYTSQLITYVGAVTALFAGTIALTQNDIKRVIAYSTCSQLGYMFFATGVGAYNAAMFHLFTHAFFKALLFLGAGAIIHSLSDEQDMRKMGGIWKKIPSVYAMTWIGSLALSGIPFFAGYYSKDAILESSWISGHVSGQHAYIIGVIAAGLTAFYSWRLIFMTFHGKNRSDASVFNNIHAPSIMMTIPLVLLSAGAIFSGFLGHELFLNNDNNFWHGSIVLAHHNSHPPSWVIYLPLFVSISGIVIAYIFYSRKTHLPNRLSKLLPNVYLFLFNKWYFDEIYQKIFVDNSLKLGSFLWRKGDVNTIDRLGPDGISKTISNFSERLVKTQSGYIYHYALSMVMGVVLFCLFLIVTLLSNKGANW